MGEGEKDIKERKRGTRKEEEKGKYMAQSGRGGVYIKKIYE